MKKHIITILLLLLLVTGLCLLLYPTFSDWWNSFHQSRAIDAYSRTVEQLDEETWAEAYAAARDYNASLPERPNSFLLTPQQQTQYRQLLNLEGNGIMGYLEIPVIDVLLPIYHGADEGVLQVAVGHLEWTSLPVGGESSHCVLSGHRGLPSARLFTDLDAVEVGDTFSLHVLGQTLTYQVDQIMVVEPQETEALLIQPGQDLCTLVTCTPYGINSHRMLVRGSRIEPEAAVPLTRVSAEAVPVSVSFRVMPVLVLWLLWLCIRWRRKGGRKDERK